MSLSEEDEQMRVKKQGSEESYEEGKKNEWKEDGDLYFEREKEKGFTTRKQSEEKKKRR